MIDLHMHSTNSDGADTILELLKKAQEKKLTYISITDHDNCNGYNDLKEIEIEKYYNGKIIPGIEIKCSYGSHLIEVLGYKINIEKMQKWVKEYYKDKSRDKIQKKYLDILYDKCINMGLIMTPKEELKWNPKNDWASVTIYYDMKKYPENEEKLPADLWAEFDVFSKKYCGDAKYPFYIDKTQDYPTTQEAIDAIRNSDGLVFLPHLYIYKWAENKEKFIDDVLSKYKIDGIECMHNTFSDEQSQYLIDLCNKRHYFKSGGSNYHGSNKKGVDMGTGRGNMRIPEEFVEEWI